MAFHSSRQRWPSTSDPAQHFTIHKISFFDDDDANRDTPIHECALLVDERIVPFLPESIVPPGHVKPSDPPFQIAPSPTSYGLGLIATRPIPAGSPLYIEHPTIIAPQRIPLSFKDKRSAFKMLSDCLPDFGGDDEKGRKGLLNMANAYPVLGFHELADVTECKSGEEGGEEGDEPPIPQEEGILLTNAISLSLFRSASASPSTSSPPPCLQDQKHGGVFLTLNRSNHSCGPNTAHKWDPSRLSMTLYALRTIRSGEEITMTYTDITLPRRTRQETLLTRYKFPCGCAFCRFPRSEDETRAREYEDTIGQASELRGEDRKIGINQESQERDSDWVRTTLGSYRHTHPCYLKWSTDLARPDDHVISSHLRALSMIDREGLHGLARFHLEEIVLCYGALGDEENFRKWARRLLELSQVMDENLSQELTGWLQDPHKMKRWAWRKKQREYMSKLRKSDTDPVEEFFVPSLF